MTHHSSPDSAEALKPCPFCGDPPKWRCIDGARPLVIISCKTDNCPATPRVSGDTYAEVLEDWNTRAAPAQCAPTDPLTDLVERFSKALLAKLRLAEANGRSGWDRDDWEKQCQEGLLRHVDKGDPRDVAAYCAFMWHHGWITALTSQNNHSTENTGE